MTLETQAGSDGSAQTDLRSRIWRSQFHVPSPRDPTALANQAGAKMASSAPAAAFAFADRLCRLIVPSARDLLVRAQTHRACGRIDAAIRDLAAAMNEDPTDPLIDRAALAWGDGALRLEASRRIALSADCEPGLRRKAIEVLFDGGARTAQFLQRDESAVTGWLAWSRRGEFRIEFHSGGEAQAFFVDPDPEHPLAVDGVGVAEIRIEAEGAEDAVVDLLFDGVVLESVVPAWKGRPRSRPLWPQLPTPAAGVEPLATIIVPVFEDFEATRDCLEALERARPAFAHRIIVVDDASPNQALKDYVSTAAARGAFELLRNERNLGFAAAVNAALAERLKGDALLLNADVVLPPGAIDRLYALSRLDSDIGTVTPFTNNGELNSYPSPNESNPLPSPEGIADLDRLARAANGDALIDMPNGVGFCLYITEACLAAVGRLPEVYAQGYFEDVEFCLAARERGFRNVAAPGVYVGHAGSKSFGARKRALVMRNLELIESRFPGYQLETAAFVALDPLRPYRSALDAMTPPAGSIVVVACGPDAADALCRGRADRAKRESPEATVLHLTTDARGRCVRLAAVGGGSPQTLQFDFGEAKGREAFLGYIKRLGIRRVELMDAAGLPEPALDALLSTDAEIVLYCADLGWFLPTIETLSGPCSAPHSLQPCEACRSAAAAIQNEALDASGRRARLGRALERAARVAPLDRLSETFARRVFRARAGALEAPDPPARALTQARKPRGDFPRLGVLCPQPSVAVDRLLLRLARTLAALGAPGSIFILGACVDDEVLMATQRAFVTGPARAEEYVDLARYYEIDALLSPDRSRGFGDLDATAAALELPKGYFDWSFGAFPVEAGDLSLDPRICEEKAATRIIAWINAERGGGK